MRPAAIFAATAAIAGCGLFAASTRSQDPSPEDPFRELRVPFTSFTTLQTEFGLVAVWADARVPLLHVKGPGNQQVHWDGSTGTLLAIEDERFRWTTGTPVVTELPLEIALMVEDVWLEMRAGFPNTTVELVDVTGSGQEHHWIARLPFDWASSYRVHLTTSWDLSRIWGVSIRNERGEVLSFDGAKLQDGGTIDFIDVPLHPQIYLAEAPPHDWYGTEGGPGDPRGWADRLTRADLTPLSFVRPPFNPPSCIAPDPGHDHGHGPPHDIPRGNGHGPDGNGPPGPGGRHGNGPHGGSAQSVPVHHEFAILPANQERLLHAQAAGCAPELTGSLIYSVYDSGSYPSHEELCLRGTVSLTEPGDTPAPSKSKGKSKAPVAGPRTLWSTAIDSCNVGDWESRTDIPVGIPVSPGIRLVFDGELGRTCGEVTEPPTRNTQVLWTTDASEGTPGDMNPVLVPAVRWTGCYPDGI